LFCSYYTKKDEAGNTDKDNIKVNVVKANLVVNSLCVSPEAVIGESIAIEIDVENTGGAELTDSVFIANKTIKNFSLLPGKAKDISIYHTFNDEGYFSVSVGEKTKNIQIKEALKIDSVNLDKINISKGEDIKITANITNNDDDSHTIDVAVAGKTVHIWTIEGNVDSKKFSCVHKFKQEGDFLIQISDKRVREVTVMKPEDNIAPSADAGIDKTVDVGQNFTLDATSSSDNNNIINYKWELDNGDSKTGEEISYSYEKEGIYTVELTVKDEAGNEDTDTVQITVEDTEDSNSIDNSEESTPGFTFMIFALSISLLFALKYKNSKNDF